METDSEIVDFTSNFGSDSELSVSIECESPTSHTSEVESEGELEVEEGFSEPEGLYMDEPLADESWLQEYYEEIEEAERRNQALQNRFDRTEALETWCECGNCDLNLLQNAGECLCCKEIEKCVESLESADVSREVESIPVCVTLHPGFSAVCLNRWSLRSAGAKYKTIDGRKYRQIGSEEKFLRGVAYREFTHLMHGFLGGKRIPLPACAYHAIRSAFALEDEGFVGFEDNE